MRFCIYTVFFYLGNFTEALIDIWDWTMDLVITVRICLRRGLG